MAKWGEIKCPMCAELEARIEELTELCALEYQRAWLLETQKNIAEEKLTQQDALVQAAVAAALTEAAQAARLSISERDEWPPKDGDVLVDDCMAAILALITSDAQAALDRVRAAERTMRPIGTAPKDGTHILVAPYGDLTDLQVSWFIEGEDRWANWSWSVEPSHWFPLPVIREGGE